MALLTFEQFTKDSTLLNPVLRYDLAKEPKLPHTWWEVDTAEIQRLLKEISQPVIEVLEGIPECDKELKHVLNTAKAIGAVQNSRAAKVALIGAQGAGKSLLINALFDCDGLSLTGADGAACTASIIKYAYYPSGATSGAERRFFAEVKFLDENIREDMIKEHVRAYAHYQNDLADTDDECEPASRSANQDELDRRLNDTAEDVFQTLFGTKDQFLDSWAACNSRPSEFACLCSLKCDEALANIRINSSGVKKFSGDDGRELLEKIRPYLTKIKGEVCLWPLVDCVTIRFDHPLLRNNLEIIDLPGSGDINMVRAFHAEGVKDSVDVEIILADTIRIMTDDVAISAVRSGILNHGASNVKMIATKIDLAQYSGKRYDQIKSLVNIADEEVGRAEENGDDSKALQHSKYKIYLERSLKEKVVNERSANITMELATRLMGNQSKDGNPMVYHVSAAEYMKWIAKDKVAFKNQSALSPRTTGIPDIRQFLFSIPAKQNLADHALHLNVIVPAFIDKLKRVVTPSDRDADFKTIADDFDTEYQHFMTDFVSQVKSSFHSFRNIGKIKADASAYKKRVEMKVQRSWFSLKGPTFNKILRSRGIVEKGSSRAKGLELGCNWNLELADILAPGFLKWNAAYSESMAGLKEALIPAFDRLHHIVLSVIKNSAANLVTVEKAKLKWDPLRHQMTTKIIRLMDEVAKQQDYLLRRAIMGDDRENNLVASVTDHIYSEVFHAVPPLRETAVGKPKRYVTSKVKHQKSVMDQLFLSKDNHYVDRVINTFQNQLDNVMTSLIDKTFEEVQRMLCNFSDSLKEHAPINYDIRGLGTSIRGDLEQRISILEKKAEQVRGLLPAIIKQEDDMAANITSETCNDARTSNQDLTFFLKKAMKSKAANKSSTPKLRTKFEGEGDSPRKKPRH